MIINKPMRFYAPDGGGGAGGGAGGAGGQGGAGGAGGAGKPGSDEGGAGGAGTDKSSQAGGGESQDDDLPTDPEELKKALKAERAARRTLSTVHEEMKSRYTKRDAEDEAKRAENLKKQGQFEALYNEAAPKLEAANATIKRQEAALSAYLEAELKGVPETMRGLIPDGDTASKLEWISKAKAAGAFTPPAGAGGKGKAPDGSPPPGGKGATMPSEEFYKLPAKERAAYMAKGGTIS